MCHEFLHTGIIRSPILHSPEQFLHHSLGVLIQCISALSLLSVELCQFISKDLFGQSGFDVRNSLLGKKSFCRIGTVTDHVDVGMVGFIVEGSVPAKILPGNFQPLGHLHGVAAQEIPPTLRIVVPQASGILSTQGDDREPHGSRVTGYRLRHL